MRKYLLLCAVALTIFGVGSVHAQIELVQLTSGLDNPVGVVNAGDGSGRLFIVGQRGSIFIWNNGLDGVFLDIEDRVNFGGERGLLGLAFHPDYAQNGQFFVHYSNNAGDTTVSRFNVTANPDVADPTSEQILLVESQPFSNHNGGQINFGPDGYLYIGLGDGGSANDPGNRAQDLDELLGKMLRIDVDGGFPYGIPADNPFVGNPGRDEIWAYGLRNPWRFSFDRENGNLIIGDVGQNQIEEIDLQLADSAGGENYGWRRMEGSDCFDPPQNCNDGSLILPILEYEHFGGGGFNCSVTGGYSYRGASDFLDGVIIFADYCSGKIWGGVEQTNGTWMMPLFLDTTDAITSFGEGEDGELYMVEQDGAFYSIVPIETLCETTMSAATYGVGDTVTIQTQRVANLSDFSANSVRVQIGVLDPSGAPTPVINAGPLTVPAAFDNNFGPISVLTVDGSTPTGEWTALCRITNEEGFVMAQDQTTFEVQ